MSRPESLRLVLGATPIELVEAILGYRVADRWVHETDADGTEEAWVRYPLFDGTLLREDGAAYTPAEYDREPLGHVRPIEGDEDDAPRWEVWDGDEVIGVERMLAIAQHRLDERLRADGWSCP